MFEYVNSDVQSFVKRLFFAANRVLNRFLLRADFGKDFAHCLCHDLDQFEKERLVKTERATVTHRLWAGEEFWFFCLGAILWLIAFFGLPRPILIYVFGHELTHALWVWLMGGRVSRFRVSRDGGHIVTSKANFWIALAPYFFPLYSILAIAIYGALSLFLNVQPYGRLLYAVIGATWAFHFTFTCWMIPKNQTDLSDQGTFFSLVVIYLMNLLLLSVMLILASPEITFAGFGADLLMNLGNFANWLVDLFQEFVHRH